MIVAIIREAPPTSADARKDTALAGKMPSQENPMRFAKPRIAPLQVEAFDSEVRDRVGTFRFGRT
jgi:hypothetical protein